MKQTRKQIKQQTSMVRRRTEAKPHPARRGKGQAWCPKCHGVLVKKHWVEDPKLHAELSKEASLKTLCPVDEMRKLKSYEGLVILQGLSKIKDIQSLYRLIENAGEAAKKQDFQDQILAIKTKKDELWIECSDNQLATRLARKMTRAFPGMKKGIEREDGEASTTVRLTAA